MTEIGHIALNNPDPPPPEPAKPILASQLLELERKQRRRFTEQGRDEKISAGCSEIDEILGGGCERGIVVGISAEGGEGRLISLHLLSSILISHLSSHSESPAKPRASIIDTTGSFPVSLLAKVLKSRILSSRAASAIAAVQSANYAVSDQRQAEADADVEKDVQQCLEMVAISRVFDIEGLWEVLGEVRRNGILQDDSGILENETAIDPGANNQRPPKPPEILDSDEELTPEDDIPLPPAAQPSNHIDTGVEIIIIDNLTHIITELLSRKEKSSAHSLLSLLSITLHTITHTTNTLTLLHNTVVPSKSTYPTATSHTRGPQVQQPVSIFLSNPVKPALGQVFTQFPELHLLVGRLPKTRRDAEVLYGRDEDGDGGSGERDGVGYCWVVEVLKDETPNLGSEREDEVGKGKGKEWRRFGWREQRWTAVETTGDGTALVGAFQVRGNMRGMELEREKIGGLTDVGNAAKMWGFGGRRV